MKHQEKGQFTSGLQVRPAQDPFVSQHWTQREHVFVTLGVCLFWAAAALRWPLSEMVVPWDSKTQFYAFFRFLGKAAELGSSPYWNPFHYGGHPSIADPQSLIFNPLFRALSYVAPQASMYLFDWTVQLHLLIGGLSMVYLMRRWGLRPVGAFFAALIFMFGGSASSRLQHAGEIMSYSTFPLALLLLDVTLKRRSFLAAIAFGFIAGLMALGRDQVAYLGCLALLAYAVYWLAGERPFVRTALRALPVLLVCGLAGFLTIIVPILLTIQFAELSNRPEIGFDIAAMGSLYPANFATLFSANIFGTYDLPYSYYGPGYETRPLIDSTDRAINYLFAGTLTPLVFLLIPRTRSRGMTFCLALLVATVIYAIGTSTPIFRVLYDFLPGVDLYRRPADATFLFNMAFAALAGASLSRFEIYGLRRPSLQRGLIAGLLIALPLCWGLYFNWRQGLFSRSLLELTPSLFALFVASTLFFAVKRAQARFALAVAVVIITGVELNIENAVTPLNAEPMAPYADLEEPTGEAARALAALDKALKTDVERKELRSRTEVLGLGGPWQNIAMVQGFESTNGYNPLRIGAYDTMMRPGQNSHVLGYRKFTPSAPSLDSPLCRRVGLRYILTSAPKNEIPTWYFKDADKLKTVFAGEEIFIFRLPNVLPRAALVSRVTRIDRPDTVEPDTYPPGDLRDQALIYSDTQLDEKYPPDAPPPVG
ncbi:MAG: hypothetical protein K2P80_13570, partial [Beijerinckiaceae bacterium]|nr:hypothetical protein [Beijerinckiaceae bacterium]